MKIAEYPYQDYYISKPIWHKNEKRYMVVLCPIDKESGLKRTSTSYARYLMSVHLKRHLEKWEHVDHIDDNKTNDVIENLQLLSQKENTIKANKFYGITETMVPLICDLCKVHFTRRKGNEPQIKGSKFCFCSKICLNKARKDDRFYRHLGHRSHPESGYQHTLKGNKECKECRETFRYKHERAQFCSKICKMKAFRRKHVGA